MGGWQIDGKELVVQVFFYFLSFLRKKTTVLTQVRSSFFISPTLELYCLQQLSENNNGIDVFVVFSVPTTAKVIWRWGHSLKSNPTDW